MPLERSEDIKADIIQNTQKFTNMILENIKIYPEQWTWMHKRFKNRPTGEPKIY